MTDVELLLKKLAFIETCLAELRALARPEAIERDVKERRFIEHTLQVAIQAVQDVASHIVSDQRLGEPESNQALLTLLAGAHWLSNDTASALRSAIGFRNVLVHGYAAVDPGIIRNVLERHLDDLHAFVEQVRTKLQPS